MQNKENFLFTPNLGWQTWHLYFLQKYPCVQGDGPALGRMCSFVNGLLIITPDVPLLMVPCRTIWAQAIFKYCNQNCQKVIFWNCTYLFFRSCETKWNFRVGYLIIPLYSRLWMRTKFQVKKTSETRPTQITLFMVSRVGEIFWDGYKNYKSRIIAVPEHNTYKGINILSFIP